MTTPQHAKRKHSRLAPSKASVWTVCTASPILEQENEDQIVERSSKWADEGTQAHEVADCLMRGQKVPHWATREMMDHGNGYKRFCASLHPLGMIEAGNVEMEVPLFYLPEDNGHVDYILLLPDENEIHVVDYKYGAGVTVNAYQSKQMTIYARSAIEDRKLSWLNSGTKVSLHIYQPRSRKEDGQGPASTWATTWDVLNLFSERDIAVPAQLILSREADHLLKFKPSDETCRWCPCAAFCGARNEYLITGVPVVRQMVQAAPIQPTAPENLTDAQLGQILAHAGDLKKWLGQVEEYVWGRNRAGRTVPGTKLVAGRGTRTWASEMNILVLARTSALGVNAIEEVEPHLLSPFALEEKMKAAGVKKKDRDKVLALAVRTPGAPVLATADDPRPEWTDNALHEFSNLDLDDLLG